jgi:8-amino-3,8-dideoxy-alpha-D-manno-octulosonate transaminase
MCGSMGDLDALQAICTRHNLLFVEDACQAIGGTYKGRPLGSVGDLGCFSFDFVKTITCGEGGAVITNNKNYYTNADHYSDHGHDHIGPDRGAETHPFLGYNFRISELHAAVGLAQVKRLPEFIALQKKNYTILRDAISNIPEVTFRRVPEGGEESYAFLNFFLPDVETSRKVVSEFKKNGVDVCWNYFDNNWHYVRKWNHLKDAKSLFPMSAEVRLGLEAIKTTDFEQSDYFIGRNISCLIKLSWTEAQINERASKMVSAIKASL